MIFLSRYMLSHTDCLKLRLTDSYSIHRVVLDLFPRDQEREERILFVDKGFRKGERQILILSGAAPAIGVYGEITTKSVPERFLEYPAYYFEVVVNAVRRKNATGRLEPIRKRDDIQAWFVERALKNWGFECIDILVSENRADRFGNASGGEITLARARITGGLKVTDRERFKEAFHNGLGRGKAFGCGLLQLRPVQ